MPPKTKRLSAREVKEVLAQGRTIRFGGASMRFSESKNAKVAVVVSKKIAGNSVERNRLRRIGYKALFPLPKNIHLVLFIHKKDINPADIQALCLKLS